MTLLQFISSKLDEDTPVGDLACDAYKDKEFRSLKTEKEKISYLEWKCGNVDAVSEAYKEFIKEFNSKK